MPRLDENIDALVGAFGTANVGLIWGLANVRWRDDAHRDSFIDIAVRLGMPTGDGFTGTAVPRPVRVPGIPMPPVELFKPGDERGPNDLPPSVSMQKMRPPTQLNA